MKAKSIKGKSTQEIAAALNECMSDGFSPTLAIVFLSVEQDRNTICGTLDEAGINVFGSTTNGEFIDEETETGSVAILLLDIKKNTSEFILQNFSPIAIGIQQHPLPEKPGTILNRLPSF